MKKEKEFSLVSGKKDGQGERSKYFHRHCNSVALNLIQSGKTKAWLGEKAAYRKKSIGVFNKVKMLEKKLNLNDRKKI